MPTERSLLASQVAREDLYLGDAWREPSGWDRRFTSVSGATAIRREPITWTARSFLRPSDHQTPTSPNRMAGPAAAVPPQPNRMRRRKTIRTRVDAPEDKGQAK